jgi:hypothetical protein
MCGKQELLEDAAKQMIPFVPLYSSRAIWSLNYKPPVYKKLLKLLETIVGDAVLLLIGKINHQNY